ncbi:MAG TPA: hypothetical protein VLB79_13215 [Solirubrobacterales bacterium]|nr:hypothetical protein [Solirubrobacterales bacterium]
MDAHDDEVATGAEGATAPDDEYVELEPPAAPPPAGITFVITIFLAGLDFATTGAAGVPGPSAGSFPALSWKARNSKATAKIASAARTVGRGAGLGRRGRGARWPAVD